MGILSDWQIQQLKDVVVPLESGIKREGKISYGVTSYGVDCRVGYKFKVFTPVNCSVIDPKDFSPKNFVNVDLTPLGHEWNKICTDNRSPRYYECANCKRVVPYDYAEDPVVEEFYAPCPKRGQPPDHILIPPNSFALAETVETFDIPRDCLGLVVGKSTYARCGLICNCTPLEPEWRGKLTVELSNTAPLPMKVYCDEGIFQLLLFRADAVTQLLLNDNPGVLGKGLPYCAISYKDKQGKYQEQQGLTLPKVD